MPAAQTSTEPEGGAAARQLTVQGAERRRQLLAAAEALFAERGYATTRIVDICREAGVAKGLFYWYFDSKEAVFRDLADDLRLRLRREQARAMRDDADPLTNIRTAAEASIRFLAAHARSFALLAAERDEPADADAARVAREVHTRDTERLVRAGIDSGSIRDDDPHLLALSVLATVGWFSEVHRNGGIDLSVDELAAFVGRHVAAALAAPGSGAPPAVD